MATQCAVLESKADMQKRGQASPDDGDALALTFAQASNLSVYFRGRRLPGSTVLIHLPFSTTAGSP
jgi:hypothetical protein